MRLLRGLYTVGYAILLPFIVLRLLWRSIQQPRYRERLYERFGFYHSAPPPPQGLWIHTVSVGEFLGILPLISALLKEDPALIITVTTTTATGSAAVQKQLAGRVYHVYAPYDLPGILKRCLTFLKPRAVILMETEIWPNLLRVCDERQIPCLLVNARMSARSARGYARFSALTRSVFAQLTWVAAQYRADAKRFQWLGVAPNHITVTGSLKFDTLIPADLEAKKIALKAILGNRTLLIVASTHAGEEALFLDILPQIKQVIPDLLLVVVPRHPERFASVAKLCIDRGFTLVKRTDNIPCAVTTDIFLGDTLGELF